jgi:hypothetical protein
MEPTGDVREPELERQGKRLAKPGVGFSAVAACLLVPGVVMLVLGHSLVFTIGIVLVALSLPFASIAVAALSSAAVARWAARHRSFA